MNNALIRPDELCRLLNITMPTLRSWVQARRVPFIRLPGGRQLRFKKEDIEKMLEKGRMETE